MMFEPTGELAKQIFRERYAIHPEETWQEASARVARIVSSAESNPNHYFGEFYTEIVDGRFMPGGRIWFGAGREQQQLLNCFVVPVEDSIEGWMKAVYDVGVISAKGGGVGLNVSPARPRGSVIRGNGGVSTGAVSLMQMINETGEVIVGGGGRRTALMLALDITHPDMLEFLDVKLDLKRLNNANISLIINMDPQEFAKKVRNDEQITLTHAKANNRGTVGARDLWHKLVGNAWASGEPGILNGWLANEQNNIGYYKPLVSTNPCGEIWLEEYGCCDLGALVLPRFVDSGVFDWQQLRSSVRVAIRFLDNVLSINKYPLPELEANCQAVRRLGLGVMGLHNMLLKLGMKYSSPEARKFIDKLFFHIKVEAYQASIDLAREKGPFPAYDERMLDSGFMETMPLQIRNGVKQFGIRNCALLTIAPTGTTSLVQEVSSGIEPLYAPVHIRNFWSPQPDGTKVNQRQLVVDPAFIQYGDLCEGAMDISPAAHFEVQRIVQNHIDNAVSKTINLPQDITPEELSDLWLDYLPYCKGTTIYRSGSRGQEPLEYVSSDRAQAVMQQWGYVIEEDQEFQASMDCVGGVCSIDSESMVQLSVPV